METNEDKKIFSNNLRYLMESRGITKQKICADLGVKYTTLVDWYNGKTYPRIGRMELLANYFNVRKSDLIEGDLSGESSGIPKGFIRLPRMKEIPIVGEIACGSPILAQENHVGTTGVPENVRADFALVCRGDSMINAGINDGDLVYIRAQDTAENGQIAAVRIGDEATLKRVRRMGKTVILMPENPAYEPILLTEDTDSEIRIEGIAVAFIRMLEE